MRRLRLRHPQLLLLAYGLALLCALLVVGGPPRL
jgi:hypothetical protein